MIELGKHNTLTVVRRTENGFYLEDMEQREVLLPNKFISDDIKIGDTLDVFVYNDSEDRLTATTQEPKIVLDTFAYLQVKDVSRIGAFMDWGLDKDLFVPFKEQPQTLEKGDWHIIYLYLDWQTNRLVGSAKINRFLEKEDAFVEEGQEVDLLIVDEGKFGVNVIVNHMHAGLIFFNDLYEQLTPGQITKGFVKQVRPDFKIDITLQKTGFANIEPNAQKILEKLKEANGFLALNDKSDPYDIVDQLQMSKKSFKKAIGSLYKQKRISILANGIRLLN